MWLSHLLVLSQFLESKGLWELPAGSSLLTHPGKLEKNNKAIAHTVGPNCSVKEEKDNFDNLLKTAYESSLKYCLEGLEQNQNCLISSDFVPEKMNTIAFPSISTGIFGGSIDIASKIALETIKEFIKNHPGSVQEVHIVFLPHEQNVATAYKNALDLLVL